MSTDFHLDSTTWDIVIKDGDICFLETLEDKCRQDVTVAIKTFKGEWFRDITRGVPWIENENNSVSLLGKQDKLFFDATIKKVILGVEGVLSIIDYKHSLDKVTGQVNLDITIESGGGPITITTQI